MLSPVVIRNGRPDPDLDDRRNSPVAEKFPGKAIAGKRSRLVHAAKHKTVTLIKQRV